MYPMISFVKISLPRRDNQHRGLTEGKLFPSFSPLFRGFRVDIAWIYARIRRGETGTRENYIPASIGTVFANSNHSDIVQQAQFLLTP